MKTIHIPRRSKTVNKLLDQARYEEVIVQAPDGTEFMLTVIDDFEKEITATRKNKKLMDLLESRARQAEWIPLEQVERELGLAEEPAGKKKSKRKNHQKS